jgi:hypothetical protein
MLIKKKKHQHTLNLLSRPNNYILNKPKLTMTLPTLSYGVDFFSYSTSKINLSAASQNDVNANASNFHNYSQ